MNGIELLYYFGSLNNYRSVPCVWRRFLPRLASAARLLTFTALRLPLTRKCSLFQSAGESLCRVIIIPSQFFDQTAADKH